MRAVDGLSLRAAGRSGAGHRRRVRLRQERHRAVAAGSAPRHHRRVSGPVRSTAGPGAQPTDEQVRRLRGAGSPWCSRTRCPLWTRSTPSATRSPRCTGLHNKASRRAARGRAVEVLDQVRIPDAGRRAGRYPHEFSGGMRQRALIAMALACRPRFSSPTSRRRRWTSPCRRRSWTCWHEVRTETGMALILVSHDLGVVAGTADDVRGDAARQGRRARPGGRRFSAPRRRSTPASWSPRSHGWTQAARVEGGRRRAAGASRTCAKVFPAGSFLDRVQGERRRRRRPWTCCAARRSAWSARAAAARPRWPA